MTDEGRAEPVAGQVRRVLACILRRAIFPGRVELLQQVENVDVVDGPITMLNLRVTGDALRSPCSDGPVPLSAMVTDADGIATGELLIWIKDGYLSALEFAWWTDDPPENLPSIDRIHVVQK
jgi:hypothetical protein